MLGMTNSGKTYTVQGTESNPGLLPRLVKEILETNQQDSNDSDLQVSMLEIYQEKIFDLLGKRKDKLSIRDGNGRVEVVKLSSHPISSPACALKLMDAAAAKRFLLLNQIFL
jgi:kinesin family protein 22